MSLTIRLLSGGTLELEEETNIGMFDCVRSRILIDPKRVLRLLTLLRRKEKAIRLAIRAEKAAGST